MRPPALATLGLLLVGLLLLLLPCEAAQKPTPCQSCRQLVDKFNQGMVDTAKKNFGGGNTAWEEKSLSKYEFSEVRLLEIVEGLCGSSDFECNRLLEAQEELLEAWWLRLKKEHPDLFEWFCVKMLKVCCSPGTYGPDCRECQGGSARPCSGNGRCSGDGSREGDGACQCLPGYRGPLCADCVDGYFSSLRNETHSVCTACDESCKTCTGPTNRDCAQCEAGWAQEDGACVDVDECAAETPPCGPQQYCQNVGGSFHCEGVRRGLVPRLRGTHCGSHPGVCPSPGDSSVSPARPNATPPVWAAWGRAQGSVKSACPATRRRAASVQMWTSVHCRGRHVQGLVRTATTRPGASSACVPTALRRRRTPVCPPRSRRGRKSQRKTRHSCPPARTCEACPGARPAL